MRALDLDNRATLEHGHCDHCFREAEAAGLVAAKGQGVQARSRITDQAAVDSLRKHNDELRAARGEYLDAEPELTVRRR